MEKIKNHCQQEKKEKDLPLGISLGEQQINRGRQLQRVMPIEKDNHPADF